jgi:hypothetical protein
MASNEGLKKFLESSVETSNAVLEHYDFVISDISSELSNPILEARKAPTIEFLKAMRGQWQKFRDDEKSQLEELKRDTPEGGSDEGI